MELSSLGHRRRSKEYLAVKNLVHNELDITREDIKSMIRIAVQEEIHAFMKTPEAHHLYQQTVKTQMEQSIGTGKHGLDYRMNLRSIISNQISEMIAEKFQIDINLKEENNGDTHQG